MYKLAALLLIICGGLLGTLQAVTLVDNPPDNAKVWIDIGLNGKADVYVSQACFTNHTMTASAKDEDIGYWTTLRQARTWDAHPDKKCRDAGGFTHTRSALIAVVENLTGQTSRWNPDGTWRW